MTPLSDIKTSTSQTGELSAARAAAVLHYMVEECGVSPTRVYIAGFGQYQPMADNKSKTGKAKTGVGVCNSAKKWRLDFNMIVIVDYGMGNLRSVEKGFERFGFDVKVTDNPTEVKNADKLVLPGVGGFSGRYGRLKAEGGS